MNYFEFYAGDYQRDTADLSLAEHGAFLMLLSTYYSTERPIPADNPTLFRLVRAMDENEKASVISVADRFFPVDPSDGMRHNARADREIAKARIRIDLARSNGKRGGRPKNPEKTQPLTQPLSEPLTQPLTQNEPSGKAHHTPHAIHQEAEDQKQRGGKPPALALPDWLPASAWADWHKFRNSRKGWTPKARELSLSTLTKLYAKGHDPTAVIEQSIERGWTGLFELKSETSHENSGTGRKLSVVERIEQNIRDRREREPFDDQPFAQLDHGRDLDADGEPLRPRLGEPVR